MPTQFNCVPGLVGSLYPFWKFNEVWLNRFCGITFPGNWSRTNPPLPFGRVVSGSKIPPASSLKLPERINGVGTVPIWPLEAVR